MKSCATPPASRPCSRALRVQGLHLQPLPVGDVAEEADVEAGEEVRSRGTSATWRVPSISRVSHSARIGSPARNAPSPPRGGSLVRGQEVVDLRPTRSRFARRSTRRRGIDVDEVPLVVDHEDPVECHVEHGAQLLLLLAQRRLGKLARDRGSNQARAVRKASISAGDHSRSVGAFVEADVPTTRRRRRSARVISDLIPCSSNKPRSSRQVADLRVNTSLREPTRRAAPTRPPRSTCPA